MHFVMWQIEFLLFHFRNIEKVTIVTMNLYVVEDSSIVNGKLRAPTIIRLFARDLTNTYRCSKSAVT